MAKKRASIRLADLPAEWSHQRRIFIHCCRLAKENPRDFYPTQSVDPGRVDRQVMSLVMFPSGRAGPMMMGYYALNEEVPSKR
jgi:hypothetical protein